MITFLVTERSDQAPHEALARLLDLNAHTAVIPLTTAHHDRAPLHTGSRFTARTGLGPIGIDDRMRVESWRDGPPARVVIAKLGPWLEGRIEIVVRPSGYGSTIEWRQEFRIRGLPRFLEPVATPVAREAYASVIRKLLGPR